MVVKMVWTDLAGVRRARFVYGKRCSRVAKVCFALPAHGDEVAAGTTMPMSGEFRTEQAQDAIEFEVGGIKAVLADHFETDGAEAPVCARAVLRAALKRFTEVTGCEVDVGFEIEFVLVHKDTLQPVDTQVYATSRALQAQSAVLAEMVEELNRNGIHVLQAHGESAHGQFEFALKHYGAMQAADKLVIAKEIISTVATRHDLEASFLPKMSMEQAGNSTHCHIGLVDSKTGDNTFANSDGLTKLGTHFIAGMLESLPALLALTTSSPNSFLRLQPHCWAGAFHVWGVDNREAPLRLIVPDSGPSTHVEFKAFDGTGNVHIGLAGLVLAGLHGVQSELALPPPCNEDPGTLDPRPPSLPESPTAALAALEACEPLVQGLGATLVGAIKAVRLAEEAHFANFYHDVVHDVMVEQLLLRY